MKKLNSVRIKFYEFLNEDITSDDFQQWVYSSNELKHEFESDHYEDIISFQFRTEDAKHYISKMISTFFDFTEYEVWRTKKLLKVISDGEIEPVLASRKLRKLYKEQKGSLGKPFITIKLGLGFESVLDECPIETEYESWNSEALKIKLNIVNDYREDLIKTATIELNNFYD